MLKYKGPPKNYAIESVYCLQVWSDNRKITQSKIKLVPRKKKIKQKISLEYADYDDSGFRYIEGNCSTYFMNFNRWHYLDVFIFAGQGLFSIPPVNLIDVAHRNGVKVIGSIMAPVNQPQYTTEFALLFKKDGERFPIGDQLIKVTNHYGFDGWFINIEEALPSGIDSKTVIEFLIYIREGLQETNINAEIHWYDSNYVFGSSSYDNCLDNNNKSLFTDTITNKIVSDGFFLNYNWDSNLLDTSRKTAVSLARDSYSVYAGVYFPTSYTSMSSSIKTCFSHGISVGIWGYDTKQMSNTREQFNTITNNFWSSLQGIAIQKEQPINIPFGSNFSIGTGDSFWIDGQKMSNESYGQLASMDLLSEHILSSKNITISNDKVYTGGNSLCINTDIGIKIEIYNTNLNIDKNSIIVLVFDSNIDLELYLDDQSYKPKIDQINGWYSYSFEIETKLKPVNSIGILFLNKTTVYLGQMKIIYIDHQNNNYIENLMIKDLDWIYDDQLNIFPRFLLEWDDANNRCYDIYYKRPDFGNYSYLKRVYRNSTYIDNISIKGNVKTVNNKISFKVVSVDNSFTKTDINNSPSIDLEWIPPLNYSSNIPIFSSD